MPSGQVSVWVPLVVAVIGIIGIIGAQLINAWREDKRWKRELQREDQRWERERARDREQLEVERRRVDAERAHDARIEWRIQRFEVYQQFLAAVDTFRSPDWYIKQVWNHTEGWQNDHGEAERQKAHIAEMQDRIVAVELMAGESVVDLARYLIAKATLIQHLLRPAEYPKLITGDLSDDEKIAQVNSQVRDFGRVREEFVREVKLELALAVSATVSDEVSPTQPSGPTS